MIELTSRLFIRYARVARFLVSGGSAAATNLAVYYVCVYAFHVWYLASAIISFLISFIVSFILQKFWTFKNVALDVVKPQLAGYLTVALLNLGLNTLMLYALVEYLHIYHFLAQVIAMGTISVFSYFVYKHMIFKPTDVVTKTVSGM